MNGDENGLLSRSSTSLHNGSESLSNSRSNFREDTFISQSPKEQKKNFFKMLNERMKALSGHLEKALKDYQKLLKERNKCLELLCVKFEDEAEGENNEKEEVSLVEEIKKALENAMGLDEDDDGKRRGKGRKGRSKGKGCGVGGKGRTR